MHTTRSIAISGAAILLLPFSLASQTTVPWPVGDGDTAYPIEFTYGEYMTIQSPHYWHDGIDIVVPWGTGVRSLADGVVRKVGPVPGSEGALCTIEDSAGGIAYSYLHLDEKTLQYGPGDTVHAGDYLGDIASFANHYFDHLHLSRTRDAGEGAWNWIDRVPVAHPLRLLSPNTDPEPPQFENADVVRNLPFRFCANGTGTYLDPTKLSGDVDIIAKVYDRFEPSGSGTARKLIPYAILLFIQNDQTGEFSVSQLSFVFDGKLPGDSVYLKTVFQSDGTVKTKASWYAQDFFFNVTNSDGNATIDSTDADHSWVTTDVPDGKYTVTVVALDCAWSTSAKSMHVTVENSPSR